MRLVILWDLTVNQSTVLWFPAKFLFQSWRNKMAFWNCYKVSPPETTTWILSMPKRKSWLPASDCIGNLPKSCSSEPNSSWSFMHGSNILVGTFQLARSSNVSTSRDSFSWIVFSNYGLGLCSHCWQFWESRCWRLRLEWCLYHCISCTKVWGPVTFPIGYLGTSKFMDSSRSRGVEAGLHRP